MGVSKADELENYVKKSATQVPTNLFDLDEWAPAIAAAKELRTIDAVKVRKEIDLLKKNANLFFFIAKNPLKNSREEIQLLRADVHSQLATMKADMLKGSQLIMFIVSKLKGLIDLSSIEKVKKKTEK
jgi:hypothetical protein